MRDSPRQRARKRASRHSGQSTVEAAIILPAMVFLVLLTMQLTMVQQARIMTEYAAFCAARAGIVFNGDNTAMVQAATVALSPTIGRTESMSNLQFTMTTGVGLEKLHRNPVKVPLVTVETLRPLITDIPSSGATNGKELDFDDIRGGGPAIVPGQAASPSQANVLQIRVHYYYHMKIPFANQMLQAIMFAQHSGVGAWNTFNDKWGVIATTSEKGSDVIRGAQAQFGSSGRVWNTNDATLVPAYKEIVAAAEANPPYFYFPLAATYSMRMQSNFFVGQAAATAAN